jgi:hypothetical protein
MDVHTLAARLGVPPRAAARAEELVRLAAAKMGTAGAAALVRPAVCLDLACSECVPAAARCAPAAARVRVSAPPLSARPSLVANPTRRAPLLARGRMRAPVDRETLIRTCGATSKARCCDAACGDCRAERCRRPLPPPSSALTRHRAACAPACAPAA